jgi:hypothetical protein
MDWYVSNGSLTPISYSDIQFWGPMYQDSGGGVSYSTFMGNTYMADWSLTSRYNEPDIVYQAYWQGNTIKMIDDLFVPASATINIVFKIVLTEDGGYTFSLTSTAGVTLDPSTWTLGGINTVLVPYDHSKIQWAIDNSSAGYTIVVYEGTYTEDLNIPETKTNLDIKSFAGASVTIKGVQNVPVASWPLAIPNIAVNASGVKLHGFTIESPGYAAGFYSSGVIIGAPNVEIFDNTFKVLAGANTDEISQGMQTWHSIAVPSVDISGLSIRNNTFTHLNDGAAGYEAIYLNLDTGYSTATISNNTFSGKLVRAITTERSNVAINNNTIITDLTPGLPGGYQGINIGGSNSGNMTNISVVGNTIKGSGTGSGFSYGIKIGYADTSALTAISITGNTIQMNDVGIRVRYSAAGIRIKWNNFADNTNFAVNNENTTQALDASYNWWGNETGPNHAANPYPGSLGDKVSDNAVFEPWLIKPYPPLAPIAVVYVNPQFITLDAPALGTMFTVNVTIANVSMMYGFQFTLKWNSSLITLTNPTTADKIPTVWGSNYIKQYNYSLTGGNYSLFESARSPAPPFNGTVTVATLIFKSVYDPTYPNNVTCSLALENVTISDPTLPVPKPILRLVYSGNYLCISGKSRLLFTSEEYSAKNVPMEFDAYINITNVVNLQNFSIEFKFNATLLRVLYINVTSFSGNPTVFIGWLEDTGYVNVTGISPYLNGTKTLARVRFKVENGFVWNTQVRLINSTLNFTIHDFNNGTIQDEPINGTYLYRPVPGDLDMDGVVTIIDLSAAAKVFGTSKGETGWFQIADLNCDDTINILDIVIIARNFGREEPEQ